MYRHGIAMMGAVLFLNACAGGENLYARALDDFEHAVARTAKTAQTYSDLARQNQNDAVISALAVNADATLSFDVAACAKGLDAAACNITTADAKAIVASDAPLAPSVQMMRRIETYAALLADIAGAVSEAQLQARQKAADSTLEQLQSGAMALKGGQGTRGVSDFKSAAVDALGGAYLQDQRRTLLTTLVTDADPLIASASKMLTVSLGDVCESYLETQSFRINVQVLNFNSLAPLLKDGGGATEQARAQVLRREALSRLVWESQRLQSVARMDVDGSFSAMAKAHTALLKVLKLSGAEMSLLIEAIEDFSATAKKASSTLSTLQGGM